MRSKTAKADKKTAVSAEQFQTTPKKRGRPPLTPEQKAERQRLKEAGLKPAKASKTKADPAVSKAEPAFKSTKGKRAKTSDFDKTLEKIHALLDLGATHIMVDGVELAVAPGNVARINRAPRDRDDDSTIDNIHQMAKVAPMDNPDEYAEAQDRWANHEPLPRV